MNCQSISGPNTLPATSSQNNPLDEHSPLGLTLRKTPSLLDLIQMKLSQGISSTAGDSNSETFDFIVEKETEIVTMSGSTEKLKASNFPASHLKIGRWEVFIEFYGTIFGFAKMCELTHCHVMMAV